MSCDWPIFKGFFMEGSDSVVECLTGDQWVVGSSFTKLLRCVLEQDTLILAKYWLNPGPDITEKLLTWT